MSIRVNWHIKGSLLVESIFPENGGSITLRDSDGDHFTLYTRNNEWLALYRALPKSPTFTASTMNGKDVVTAADVEALIAGLTTEPTEDAA